MYGHATISPSPADIERFWALVQKTATCWLWRGGTNRQGYGVFHVGRGAHAPARLAHRIAWMLAHGTTSERACLLHDCPDGDTPTCVRPSHLYRGSRRMNAADRVAKGRVPWGEQVKNAKLTADQVRAIRARYAVGDITQYALAAQYGISQPTVNSVLHGNRWSRLLYAVTTSSRN